MNILYNRVAQLLYHSKAGAACSLEITQLFITDGLSLRTTVKNMVQLPCMRITCVSCFLDNLHQVFSCMTNSFKSQKYVTFEGIIIKIYFKNRQIAFMMNFSRNVYGKVCIDLEENKYDDKKM